MGIFHTLFSDRGNGKGLDPAITSRVNLSKKKIFILIVRYANALIANCIFLYTARYYLIPFEFFDNDQNRFSIDLCRSIEGHYLMPYKRCLFDEMFEAVYASPRDLSFHMIKNNTNCFPSYLFGTAVNLKGFDYPSLDYPVRDTRLSGVYWNFKVVNNFCIFLYLPALLAFFEEIKLYNKLMLKEMKISKCKFLLRYLLASIAYFLIIENLSFGSVNLFQAQECMTSVYSADDRLTNQMAVTHVISVFSLVFSALCLCALHDRNFLEIFYSMGFYSGGVFAMAGLVSFGFSLSKGPKFMVDFPSSLYVPEISFYDGSICKMISLIFAFFSMLESLAVSFSSISPSRCGFFSNRNPSRTNIHEVDIGQTDLSNGQQRVVVRVPRAV